jgi:hypothetical protein
MGKWLRAWDFRSKEDDKELNLMKLPSKSFNYKEITLILLIK